MVIMLDYQHDLPKQIIDKLWEEHLEKMGKGTGRPIPRTRRRNIEKAKKTGAEVKKND
jgi:hypothetical protein